MRSVPDGSSPRPRRRWRPRRCRGRRDSARRSRNLLRPSAASAAFGSRASKPGRAAATPAPARARSDRRWQTGPTRPSPRRHAAIVFVLVHPAAGFAWRLRVAAACGNTRTPGTALAQRSRPSGEHAVARQARLGGLPVEIDAEREHVLSARPAATLAMASLLPGSVATTRCPPPLQPSSRITAPGPARRSAHVIDRALGRNPRRACHSSDRTCAARGWRARSLKRRGEEEVDAIGVRAPMDDTQPGQLALLDLQPGLLAQLAPRRRCAPTRPAPRVPGRAEGPSKKPVPARHASAARGPRAGIAHGRR